MREWLSGGAPPCQGGGRGFDPRLALLKQKGHPIGCPFCFKSARRGSEVSGPRERVRLAIMTSYATYIGNSARVTARIK